MKIVSAQELEAWLSNADAGHCQELVLLGPGHSVWMLDKVTTTYDINPENIIYCFEPWKRLSPHLFSSLSTIQTLCIIGYSIEGDDLKALDSLSSLTTLVLESSKIGDIGAKRLADLTNLQKLQVESSNIGTEGAKALSDLTELIDLRLRGNTVPDSGLAHLCELKKLQILDISCNALTEQCAQSLVKLTNLTSLSIWGNRRSNAIGNDGALAISQLPHLTSLNVSCTKITDKGIQAIAALEKLESLACKNNELSSPGISAIASIKRLRSLDVSSIQFNENDIKQLASLSDLESLDISFSNVSDTCAEALSSLKKLTKLEIRKSQLTDSGAKAVAKLPALKFLNIRGNPITDDGLIALCALTNLETLYAGDYDVGESLIGNDGLVQITKLKKLKLLYLAKCSIGDEGVAQIAKLTCLQNLDLSYNSTDEKFRITDNSASEFAKLTQLTSLNLIGNDTGLECAISLSKLPALRHLNMSKSWACSDDSKIGDEGAITLSKSSALQSVELHDNDISTHGARVLLDAWEERLLSSRLSNLDLRFNSAIDKELMETVISAPVSTTEQLERYRSYAATHPDIPPKIEKITSTETPQAKIDTSESTFTSSISRISASDGNAPIDVKAPENSDDTFNDDHPNPSEEKTDTFLNSFWMKLLTGIALIAVFLYGMLK